jgi:hypothetical protein
MDKVQLGDGDSETAESNDPRPELAVKSRDSLSGIDMNKLQLGDDKTAEVDDPCTEEVVDSPLSLRNLRSLCLRYMDVDKLNIIDLNAYHRMVPRPEQTVSKKVTVLQNGQPTTFELTLEAMEFV